MMDFTFEQSGWELALSSLSRGGNLSAARFLTMMEQETEDAFEDALQLLEEKDILLDVADIPAGGSGETAVRLRFEKQLVAEKKLPGGLEENDPLRLYLEELAAIPACGDPEVLALRCIEGDEAAREQLMNAMLHHVVEQACALAGHSVLLLDLIQEGSLGLWQAILGCTGGDMEAWCLRSIRRAMAVCGVRQARENGVGQKLRQAMEDYRSADERLLADLGRNPTLEEIAQAMHITLEEGELLAQMLDAARTVSRAKEAVKPREESPEDELAVEDTAYYQMRQRISELLSALDEADAKLITLRYGLEGGLPLTPEETAKKLGLTPNEVIAREAAALSKLRNN